MRDGQLRPVTLRGGRSVPFAYFWACEALAWCLRCNLDHCRKRRRGLCRRCGRNADRNGRGDRLQRQPRPRFGPEARRARFLRHHPGGRHREIPRPQPFRIHPAHSGRRPGARRRRRARNPGARPERDVHARAHQRHGSHVDRRRQRTARAAPIAAAPSTSMFSPPICSPRSRCANRRRPISRKARSAPRSICGQRARSTTTNSRSRWPPRPATPNRAASSIRACRA